MHWCFSLTRASGITKDDVLKAAALAAKWKEPPRDALDTLVLLNSGLDLKLLDVYEQVSKQDRCSCNTQQMHHIEHVYVLLVLAFAAHLL